MMNENISENKVPSFDKMMVSLLRAMKELGESANIDNQKFSRRYAGTDR